ncbi:F-box family protein, putative [Theobroma cacao]|uniref:F-box family protein, putative n=1 Tax=Theobroma cacao TaxID=3641 RepID=A0A061F157_THECC|nr:F-box family protein, putative [Theobroma cacao]
MKALSNLRHSFSMSSTEPPTKFMLLPLNRDTKQLPLLDFINAPDIKIMQSCNGLLLCTSDYDHRSYFICNPVIKKFKMVSFPRPPMLEYQLVDFWSVSKIKFTSEVAIQFNHAVFFNDAIHWDSAAKESLCFDVEIECSKHSLVFESATTSTLLNNSTGL